VSEQMVEVLVHIRQKEQEETATEIHLLWKHRCHMAGATDTNYHSTMRDSYKSATSCL